ncbi:MAG: hypothetical protein AAGF84_01235 [Planctomycetota bacterium]
MKFDHTKYWPFLASALILVIGSILTVSYWPAGKDSHSSTAWLDELEKSESQSDIILESLVDRRNTIEAELPAMEKAHQPSGFVILRALESTDGKNTAYIATRDGSSQDLLITQSSDNSLVQMPKPRNALPFRQVLSISWIPKTKNLLVAERVSDSRDAIDQYSDLEKQGPGDFWRQHARQLSELRGKIESSTYTSIYICRLQDMRIEGVAKSESKVIDLVATSDGHFMLESIEVNKILKLRLSRIDMDRLDVDGVVGEWDTSALGRVDKARIGASGDLVWLLSQAPASGTVATGRGYSMHKLEASHDGPVRVLDTVYDFERVDSDNTVVVVSTSPEIGSVDGSVVLAAVRADSYRNPRALISQNGNGNSLKIVGVNSAGDLYFTPIQFEKDASSLGDLINQDLHVIPGLLKV